MAHRLLNKLQNDWQCIGGIDAAAFETNEYIAGKSRQ